MESTIKRPKPLAITTTTTANQQQSVSTPHSLPPLSGSSNSTSPPTPNSVDSLLMNRTNLASLLTDNNAIQPPTKPSENGKRRSGGDKIFGNELRKSSINSETHQFETNSTAYVNGHSNSSLSNDGSEV